MLSLDILVERFCALVGDQENGGLIVAEKRDATLDRQLDLAWLNLKEDPAFHPDQKGLERRVLHLRLLTALSATAS